MNRKGIAAIAVVLVIVVILAIAGGIWYYEAHKSSSTQPAHSSQGVPQIDYLSPSSTLATSQGGNGSAATVLAPSIEVTIHGSGFTSTGNTVNFVYGPISNLTSTDGQTITFDFSKSQSQLTQCTGSPMEANFCEDIPVGIYPISVTDADGTSNEAVFNVISTSSLGASNATSLGMATYTDPNKGYSFNYPNNFVVIASGTVGFGLADVPLAGQGSYDGLEYITPSSSSLYPGTDFQGVSFDVLKNLIGISAETCVDNGKYYPSGEMTTSTYNGIVWYEGIKNPAETVVGQYVIDHNFATYQPSGCWDVSFEWAVDSGVVGTTIDNGATVQPLGDSVMNTFEGSVLSSVRFLK